MTTRKVFEYELVISGVFGRNRRSKIGAFRLLESETELPLESVMPRFRAEVEKRKVKPGATLTLRMTPIEIEMREMNGVVFESRLVPLFSCETMFKTEAA